MPLPNKKVALDTNMLLAIVQFKVDIFSQAREVLGNVSFIIPKKVFQELEKLAGNSERGKRKIELIKKVMKDNKVRSVDVNAVNADACLEKLASQGIIVATNDKALRKKIKAFGKHIYLKKKRFIAIG